MVTIYSVQKLSVTLLSVVVALVRLAHSRAAQSALSGEAHALDGVNNLPALSETLKANTEDSEAWQRRLGRPWLLSLARVG